MYCVVKLKQLVCMVVVLCLLAGAGLYLCRRMDAHMADTQAAEQTEAQAGPSDDSTASPAAEPQTAAPSASPEKKDFIKWVDFDVPYEAMNAALQYDIQSQQEAVKLNWVDLLAYLGAKYGGTFTKYKESDLAALVEKLKGGTTIAELTRDMKYFGYYQKAYGAVLNGFVGPYRIQKPIENSTETQWVDTYGLKVFSPIAKGYYYNDFDDFGTARDYGFKRKHLGHDLMAQVGTPVVAVESGIIEAVGWNQYGGWRIGIRSFDGQRYYYYAHLRKNMPYNASVVEGATVKAGDVIGYVGRTGYSATENVNNITQPHLHFGMQLIFDESQKEGNNEIWIDCYQITKLLLKNKSTVVKNEATKEYSRVFDFMEPALEPFFNSPTPTE